MSTFRSAVPLSLLAVLACSPSGDDTGPDGELDDLLSEFSIELLEAERASVVCDSGFERDECFPSREPWLRIGGDAELSPVVKRFDDEAKSIMIEMDEVRVLADPKRPLSLDIDHSDAYFGPTFKPSARLSFRAAGESAWTELPVPECSYEAAGGGCWTVASIQPTDGVVSGAQHVCYESWCFDRLAEFLGERSVDDYVVPALAAAADSAEYIEYRVQVIPFWGVFESGESYPTTVHSEYSE